MDDIILWIQDWRKNFFDKVWKEGSVFKIIGLSNPGWSVKIFLDEHLLANILYDTGWVENSYEYQSIDTFEVTTVHDWFAVSFKAGAFKGAGDNKKLFFVLHEFRRLYLEHILHGKECGDETRSVLSKSDSSTIDSAATLQETDDIILWLQAWREKYFNVDWEVENIIEIEATSDCGWSVIIDGAETSLEDVEYDSGLIDRSSEYLDEKTQMISTKHDWYSVSVRNCTFKAKGDSTKLHFILNEFRRICLEYGEDLSIPMPKS